MQVIYEENTLQDDLKDKFPKSTLAKLKRQLPIGFMDGSGLVKGYKPRPDFKGREEKTIGRWKNQNPNANVGKLTTFVLSTLLDSVGPHADFGGQSMERKQVIIGQMNMADVLTAYFGVRLETLGKKLRIRLKCPACRRPTRITLDLGSMEITTASSWEDCQIPVELPNGIPFEVGTETKLFKNVTLVPPKWYPMESATDGDEEYDMVLRSLPTCLDTVEGLKREQWLGQDWLDATDKVDLEILSGIVSDSFPQPELILDLHCSKCKHQWQQMLDWSYDSFFGSASLL
jgi:hypothetical protein